MDPASVAALVIPVAQVAGACLKASKNLVGPSKYRSKGLQEITADLYSFNTAVENLRKHLESCEDQARLQELSVLREPLETSKASLSLIQARLTDDGFVRNLVREHMLGAHFDEKLKGCLRSLKRSRILLNDVLQTDQRTISSAIERYVRNVAAEVTSIQRNLQSLEDRSQHNHQEMRAWQVKAEHQNQDDEDRKILNWLSSLNFVTKQNDVLSRRHEKTGAWFLNSSEFVNWVAGPARMLWCPGIPGAGKTVIASVSVDHLQTIFKDEDAAVLCIFCSYADQARQTSVDLIASILEQMVQTKGVTDEIRALHRRHQTRTTRPGLKELSDLLQSVIQSFPKVFIVIDALDECPETTRDTFVAEIHKLRSCAHLLVTSRHSSSIAHAFFDAIHLEIHASDYDLEMYVRSRIQQDRRLACHVKQDLSLQEEIVATTVGKARGMFLLVQLHLELLAKQKNKRDLRKALSSLPKEINETYDQAMGRIRSQDTESVRLAERVLAWISNALRPFSVEGLQHALAVQPGDKNFNEDAIYAEDVLVSVCAGLVTVDRESQVIRLVHYTAQDYFQRLRSEMPFRNQPDIQFEIVEACITYLEFDDFESNEFTHGEGYIKVSDGLHSKYPFLDYAGKYWGHHARGYTEYLAGHMIMRLLDRESRLRLAFDLIDDSVGMWDPGPIPALTVLIYFDLKLIITAAMRFGDDWYLTCAIRYRRDTLVFFLVEHGADWHDNWDHTIRAQCSSYKLEGNETVLKLLAAKGATIDLGVDNGEFLFTTIDKEEDEPKGILLELGAKFDPQNITYYTLLMCAVLGGDEMDVCELLMGGVDVNEKNQHGRDALIYAALARHESAVKPLLEAGADVHSRDGNGMTALCAACEGGNKKIVQLLLAKGAEISAQDRSGRTPKSIAAERGHAQILRLLSGHGTDGNSEDEVEAEEEAVLGNDQIGTLLDLFRRNPGVGSPGSRFVQAVREETIKRGYDKAVGAVLDGYFRERPYDNDSMSVGQSESGPSKSSNPALPQGFTLQETQRALPQRHNNPST